MNARLDPGAMATASSGAGKRSSVSNARSSAYLVEEITSEEQLTALAGEWMALADACEPSLLFNSYEWASACWRHFHRVLVPRGLATLWILAVREEAVLRGIAPLWIETRSFFGIRTRIARFLGEGASDYGDLLVGSERCPVLEAILAHLAHRCSAWDLLELREFYGSSPSLGELVKLLGSRGWGVWQFEDSRCHTIATGNGWEAYYHSHFSSEGRRYHRRDWRRLEKTGALTVELFTDVTGLTGLAAACAEVQAAHPDASEHRPGEFNDPWFRPFLDEILATASARGWLRLAVLRRNGTLIAYFIAFLYRSRYYLYNTGYRADCQRYGAGKLLMLAMLERFFAEGGEVIDFLRGGEPYKDTWADRKFANARIRVERPGLRARIGRVIWFDLMPMLEQRVPRLHRALTVLSADGVRGFVALVSGRLGRGR